MNLEKSMECKSKGGFIGAWGATCFATFTALIGFADRNTSVLLSLVVEPLSLEFKPRTLLTLTKKPLRKGEAFFVMVGAWGFEPQTH